MELVVADQDPAALRISLVGRLDAAGTETVETAFSAHVAGAARHVLVDLAQVSFVGSLGIRMLIATARLVSRRGWKMVLFAVQPPVAEVFETVALDDLIPVLADEAAARAHLGA